MTTPIGDEALSAYLSEAGHDPASFLKYPNREVAELAYVVSDFSSTIAGRNFHAAKSKVDIRSDDSVEMKAVLLYGLHQSIARRVQPSGSLEKLGEDFGAVPVLGGAIEQGATSNGSIIRARLELMLDPKALAVANEFFGALIAYDKAKMSLEPMPVYSRLKYQHLPGEAMTLQHVLEHIRRETRQIQPDAMARIVLNCSPSRHMLSVTFNRSLDGVLDNLSANGLDVRDNQLVLMYNPKTVYGDTTYNHTRESLRAQHELGTGV